MKQLPNDVVKEAFFVETISRCKELVEGVEKTLAEAAIVLPINARALILGCVVHAAAEHAVMAYRSAIAPERNFALEAIAELNLADLDEWIKDKKIGGVVDAGKIGMFGKRFNS